MLTVEEALRQVLEWARPLAPRQTPLEACLGRVLAEDVASDVDSPPHDKSIVDGYAVVAADLTSGEARLTIVEEVVAGAVPKRPVRRGETTRIMTGAPLPEGADAVVMIERSELVDEHGARTVLLRDARVVTGQNILRRAASMRAGDVVLKAGVVLRPIEIGLLAEIGRARVATIPRPSVAILPTGNELVPFAERPSAGQIRNSNGPLLGACVARAGGEPRQLSIARDDRDELRARIVDGLTFDVLVLSGGVSAGVLDLVPGVLAELGVRPIFHKIRLKPGKPLWFGVLQTAAACKLVFGLPGNPVSSLVCCELFVRPAIAALAGRRDGELPRSPAQLTRPFVHRGDRPTYQPSRLACDGARSSASVEPLAWQGSADLRALAEANSLAIFPAGDRAYTAGETVETIAL